MFFKNRSRPPEEFEVSVVMPCLNESLTLARCIEDAKCALDQEGIAGEVIIADNGSTDDSANIAERCGARVVRVARKGYGSALLGGISAARGQYVVMGDADASYDFSDIPVFVSKLREGMDLVMGNRFRGGIRTGAMTALHRYLGNPALSMIGRVLFKARCKDFHCGLRAIRKSSFNGLGLRTTGMEFASEMVVKATLHGLKVCEVPTTLSPDGRNRPPHLRSWRDGWRHLRFMLVMSPNWLFLYPGAALAAIGVALMIWLLPGPRVVNNTAFDVHSLLYALACILVGFQAVLFSLLGRVFGVLSGLLPRTEFWNRWPSRIRLEHGLIVGSIFFIVGIVLSLVAVHIWSDAGFGALDVQKTLRIAIPAILALVAGCQIVLASLFFSLLGLFDGDDNK